jgi:hypothetical protein
MGRREKAQMVIWKFFGKERGSTCLLQYSDHVLCQEQLLLLALVGHTCMPSPSLFLMLILLAMSPFLFLSLPTLFSSPVE